jgi:hypothetical protein
MMKPSFQDVQEQRCFLSCLREEKMKIVVIAAAAMGLTSLVSAAPHQAIHLLEESYPSDFIKRQVLNACIAFDLAFDRFDPGSRAVCYRALPKASPDQAHVQVGLAANQIDLRREAHLVGAPNNDIGLMEATEAVRSGVSR